MQLNYIELCGFGSYKDPVRKEIPKGIIGIVGSYDDNSKRSNGSGKSTLVTSVLYALFGEGEYELLDDLMCDHVDQKDMYVKVNFTLMNGNTYEVERGRKKNKSYLDFFENSNRVGDESTSSKETQININNVIGMDYSMFSASVFFEQGKMDKFINTDPSDRRFYIDKTLDLIPWSDSLSKTITKLNKIRTKYVEVTDVIGKLKDSILEKEKLLSVKDEVTSIIAEQTELRNDQVEILEETTKHSSELRNIEFLRSSKKDLESKFGTLNASIKHSQAEIDIIRKRKDSADNDFNFEKELQSLESEKDSLDTLLEATKKDIDTLNENIKSIEVDSGKIQVELKILKGELIDVASSYCTKCKQSVTREHIDKENAAVNYKIYEKTQQNDEYTSLLKNSISIRNDLKIKENSIHSRLKEIGPQLTELERKKHKYELLKLSSDKDIDNLIKKIEAVEFEKQTIEKDILKLDNDISSITKSLPEILQEEVTEEDINTIKNNITTIDNEIKELTIKLGMLNQVEEDKKTLENSLLENKSNLKNIEKELYLVNALSVSFKEIYTNLFNDSITEIMYSANNIIKRILPNMEVKIYEDPSKKTKPIVISFIVDGKQRSYKRLSGGERVIANIGLRLGFSQVISKRANTAVNFVVLDEPFGSLDEENRELIRQILAMISDYYYQIIVISHDESIENFPTLIRVRKNQEGYSYIES